MLLFSDSVLRSLPMIAFAILLRALALTWQDNAVMCSLHSSYSRIFTALEVICQSLGSRDFPFFKICARVIRDSHEPHWNS